MYSKRITTTIKKKKRKLKLVHTIYIIEQRFERTYWQKNENLLKRREKERFYEIERKGIRKLLIMQKKNVIRSKHSLYYHP